MSAAVQGGPRVVRVSPAVTERNYTRGPGGPGGPGCRVTVGRATCLRLPVFLLYLDHLDHLDHPDHPDQSNGDKGFSGPGSCVWSRDTWTGCAIAQSCTGCGTAVDHVQRWSTMHGQAESLTNASPDSSRLDLASARTAGEAYDRIARALDNPALPPATRVRLAIDLLKARPNVVAEDEFRKRLELAEAAAREAQRRAVLPAHRAVVDVAAGGEAGTPPKGATT